MTTQDTRLVRLRPRSPKSGHYARDFRYLHNRPGSPYHGQWFTFTTPNVWHRVPLEVAVELAKAKQHPYRSSPPIFDVHTDDEAIRLDEQARIERERQRAMAEPTVATAVDMTGGRGLPAEPVDYNLQAVQPAAAPRPMAPHPMAKAAPAPEPMSPALKRLHKDDLAPEPGPAPRPMTVAQPAPAPAPLNVPAPSPEPDGGRGDLRLEDVSVNTDPAVEGRRAALDALNGPGVPNHPEPAPEPPVPQDAPETAPTAKPPSMEWKRDELVAHAEGLGVRVTKGMTKRQILDKLAGN